ncbi:MAG: hypothetical protein GY940_18575 [bacterium]|nr:hypothetical protein [bacterium]
MSQGIKITVQNRLITEKRDLTIYHHSGKTSYMISHSNSIDILLGTVENGDYIHFSVVSGPGNLEKECCIDLPSWCDFTVSALGNGDLSHSGDRTSLRIPPGPPVWQLKITRPSGYIHSQTGDYVIIGDSDSRQSSF